MGYPTKIATCCHCGSRTTLTLEAGRHELSCASCGAPLRDLKALPVKERPQQRKPVSHRPEPARFEQPIRAEKAKMRKPRKVKKRKGWMRKLAEEAFDLVEDIFD